MCDRTAISSTRRAFVEAINRRDADGAATFLSDDYVGMPPDQPCLRGKRETTAFWRDRWAKIPSTLSTKAEQLKIVSDIAIDEFHWATESAARNGVRMVHDEGRAVWLWRRQSDKTWRLVRSVWNSDMVKAKLSSVGRCVPG